MLGCLAINAAETVLIDAARSRDGWTFVDGGEFPGGKGSLTRTDAGLSLAYDFSEGGEYVAAEFIRGLPPQIEAITVTVTALQDGPLLIRWRDASDRVFQSQPYALAAGERTTVTIPPAGPWASAWGGTADAPIGDPVRVLVIASRGETARGSLLIHDLSVISAADQTVLGDAVELADLNAELAGWHVTGTWIRQWRRPLLVGRAVRGPQASDGQLTIAFPQLGRDRAWQVPLAGETVPFTVIPPLREGGNPRTVYALRLAVSGEDVRAERTLRLPGIRSAGVNLGAPRLASEIGTSTFGTCVHFHYGRSGAFSGWRDYETLLDSIAAVGFTWVRDGIGAKADADGTFQVDPYDLAWITAAKARGIATIGIIAMNAKEPVDVFAAKCVAIVEQTRGLVDVFELGNEPNNFGGWVDTFGGLWNGREKGEGNGTAEWVRAHLAATNAAAEAMKRVRPDITIIGLGGVPPSTHRALALGLSPAVDGVTEHPYSYSMPPEVVAYGHGFTERDGVRVGDANGTFLGLIDDLTTTARVGAPDRQVWITEFGWTSFQYDGTNEKGLYAGYHEDAQAVYLVRRFILGMVAGAGVNCQYDFLDDYQSKPGLNEANFGLLRSDRSPKPAWQAVRRMNALLGGATLLAAPAVTVEAQPMHRSLPRGVRFPPWDGVAISAETAVHAYLFTDPVDPTTRTIAVWSALPYSGEQSPRFATLRVAGMARSGAPIAIGLCSGEISDAPTRVDGDDLLIDLWIDQEPLAIRLFP